MIAATSRVGTRKRKVQACSSVPSVSGGTTTAGSSTAWALIGDGVNAAAEAAGTTSIIATTRTRATNFTLPRLVRLKPGPFDPGIEQTAWSVVGDYAPTETRETRRRVRKTMLPTVVAREAGAATLLGADSSFCICTRGADATTDAISPQLC